MVPWTHDTEGRSSLYACSRASCAALRPGEQTDLTARGMGAPGPFCGRRRLSRAISLINRSDAPGAVPGGE